MEQIGSHRMDLSYCNHKGCEITLLEAMSHASKRTQDFPLQVEFFPERFLSEGACFGRIETLAVNLFPVTRNNLGKSHWERPVQLDFKFRTGGRAKLQGFSRLLRSNRESGHEDFARGKEECSDAQSFEGRIPSFFKSRDSVQTQVIDVRMGIEFRFPVDLKDIDLTDDVLPPSSIRHIVQKIQHPPTQTRS